jgi:hypothetical protein
MIYRCLPRIGERLLYRRKTTDEYQRIRSHQLDVKAYLNLYPLVSMEVTCGQVTNIEAGQIPGRAPKRQFARITGLPTATWQAAVRSNSDLKCATVTRAGLAASHLGAGQLLSVPAGPKDITMRSYTPRPEALDGRWDPPPVCRGVAGGRRYRELWS